MRHLRDVVAAAVVLSSVLLCNPASAGVRAFVASTGNDANTASQCGPTTPCRGFTAAMSVVDPNGEIIALDAAGYGAVTVTKSVSIIANPGVYAGVAASTGTAITIATASVNVVLRGLNINNIGTATVGVNMTNGSRLVIDNCTISNFSNYGVIVNTNADVRISNSAFRDTGTGVLLQGGAIAAVSGTRFAGNFGLAGVVVESLTATTTAAAVSDSVFSGNYIGVYGCSSAGGESRIWVTRSTFSSNAYALTNDNCGGVVNLVASNNLIAGNDYGIANFGGATYTSFGNNSGGQNNHGNTTGTITTVSGF